MSDVDDAEEMNIEQVEEEEDNGYKLWVQRFDPDAKGEDQVMKKCNSTNRGGPYYEYQQNDISIVEPQVDHPYEFRNFVWTTSKHDVYHMPSINNSVHHYNVVSGTKSKILNFSGTVTPVEEDQYSYPGNLLQGLTATQVTTLAIKDKLLVAGGSRGELICWKLNRPRVSFCSRLTPDVDSAVMSCIEIYNNSSGAVHFTASNKDCVVRDYDVETFQLSKQFPFPWPVNHTSLSPDGKLLIAAGDCEKGQLVSTQTGETVRTLSRHKGYLVASAWHPDEHIFVTGSKDNSCYVWDVRNPSEAVAHLHLGSQAGAAQSIRFTSDGKFMAVAEPRGFVYIYDIANNQYKMKDVQEICFYGEIMGISFSPDTESLFIGSFNDDRSSLLQFRLCHNFSYLLVL